MSPALSVAVDLASPHAYLALAPTLALADELAIEVDWLPFRVAALRAPTKESAGDDRSTRHRRLRARYAERDLARYAEARGLLIRDLYRPVDSTLAALGLLFAKRNPDTDPRGYLERVFRGRFEGGLDLEDAGALGAVLEESGVPSRDFAGFASGEGREALERTEASLREVGVFDVPTFRVGDELLLGRQHLPSVGVLLRAKV